MFKIQYFDLKQGKWVDFCEIEAENYIQALKFIKDRIKPVLTEKNTNKKAKFKIEEIK